MEQTNKNKQISPLLKHNIEVINYGNTNCVHIYHPKPCEKYRYLSPILRDLMGGGGEGIGVFLNVPFS